MLLDVAIFLLILLLAILSITSVIYNAATGNSGVVSISLLALVILGADAGMQYAHIRERIK